MRRCRATVVDAVSRDLRAVVVCDWVGDGAMAPHGANLLDMLQKRADLMDGVALLVPG